MKKLYSARAFLAFCLVTVLSLCGGSAMAQDADYIFYEDFSSITVGNNTGTSGSGTELKISEISSSFSAISTVYKAGGAVRLGSGSKVGSLTTKTLDLSINDGKFTVSLMVKGWSSIEGSIKVTPTGIGAQTKEYTAKMADAFEEITFEFEGGQSNSTIKIETTAKRAFIDEIKVYPTVVADPGAPAAPEFSVQPGEVRKGTVVEISAEEGSKVYYTTDGEDPTTESKEYTPASGLVITEACTIKAIAVKTVDGAEKISKVATAAFTIKDETPTPPVFKDANGEVLVGYEVTKGTEIVLDADRDCEIFYTTDGTEPTTGSTLYTEGTKIVISKPCTVKAIAVRTVYNDEKLESAVASAGFTIVKAAGSYVYKKITSADELVDGGVYVVVGKNDSKQTYHALSYQNGSYRAAVAVTPYEDDLFLKCNAINTDNSAPAGAAPYEIVLEKSGESWLLKMPDGNYLKDSGDKNLTEAVSGSSWVITYKEDNGYWVIKDKEKNEYIQYNAASPRFTLYANTQNNVFLYRKVEAAPLIFAAAAEGWGTFFTDDVYEMPAGVTGYAVSVADEALTTTRVYEAGEAVPAETPLLLKSQTVGSAVYVPVLSKTVEVSGAYVAAGNQLRGLLEAGEVPAEEGDNYYYKLTTKNGGNIGFYWGAEGGQPFELQNDRRAYLVVPQTTATAMTQGFRLGGGTTTGINAAATAAEGPVTVYTLSGVRLNTTPERLPAGLYIVNGKKVLVK